MGREFIRPIIPYCVFVVKRNSWASCGFLATLENVMIFVDKLLSRRLSDLLSLFYATAMETISQK